MRARTLQISYLQFDIKFDKQSRNEMKVNRTIFPSREKREFPFSWKIGGAFSRKWRDYSFSVACILIAVEPGQRSATNSAGTRGNETSWLMYYDNNRMYRRASGEGEGVGGGRGDRQQFAMARGTGSWNKLLVTGSDP